MRRTVHLDGPVGLRGGVKGSFPVDGDYGRYQLLNWAAKFLADSLMMEMDLEPSWQVPSRAESRSGQADIKADIAG